MTHHRPLAALLLLPLVALSLATTCNEPTGASDGDAAPAAARVRLRLSGFMEGRLEPCGCAGGQLGGLPRRVFHLRQDRGYDLLIEGGNLVAGGTPLDRAKLETALIVMSMPDVGYHALGLGPRDLQLPPVELRQLLEAFPVQAVSSDLLPPEGEPWPVQPFDERPAGEGRVRLAALTLALPPGDGAGFRLLAPADAWARAMQGCSPETYRVLLVHGPPEVAREQARLEPRPDLLVCISEAVADPPAWPEPVDGVPLVLPGMRGRNLVDVTLARIDGIPTVTRYHVTPLRGSETAKGALEDQTAKLVLLEHRKQVKTERVREQMANRMPTPGGASYVGSEICSDCHEEAWDVWTRSKHAAAWQTLEEAERGTRYGWPVTAYPDCVACHVVGYGYETGFVGPEATPLLKDVGCEQCHGPGSEHVASEGEVRIDALSGDPGRAPKWVDRCVTCHDFEQSPGFVENYAERWKKIEHR